MEHYLDQSAIYIIFRLACVVTRFVSTQMSLCFVILYTIEMKSE